MKAKVQQFDEIVRGPGRAPRTLRVNGESALVHVEPRRTLLDVLRKDLGLTGTKNGCGEGTCGSCTVLIDGKAVYACLVLAVDCEGSEIETIENLTKDGVLHPVQAAFIREDAFQCGFCTPGQILAVKNLLDGNPEPSVDEIKRALSGNLCRCGAYPKIIQAALAVCCK